MDDIVFVTADSVRYDAVVEMDHISSREVLDGRAAAQYTRPSLASIHGSSYESVLTGRVERPTLASVLGDAGYATLGLSPNPNTNGVFGFDEGFDRYDSFLEPGNRGSSLRQYLANFDLLRRVYYKFYPPHAKSENRPSDREVVEKGIKWFNAAEPPRFLWIHLMETHRPYGSGDDAVSEELDQKAFFKPEKLTDAEEREIDAKYRNALERADRNIRHLLESVDSDPAFVFTADHGEGFGEYGFYSHPHQCHDVLTHVPLVVHDPDGPSARVEEVVELAQIPVTVVERAGIDVPESFARDRLPTASGDGGRNLAISEADLAPAYHGSVRTPSWRYVRDDVTETERLYDVTDPAGSETDRTDECPDVRDDLAAALRDHLAPPGRTVVDDGGAETAAIEDAETESRLRDLGYLE